MKNLLALLVSFQENKKKATIYAGNYQRTGVIIDISDDLISLDFGDTIPESLFISTITGIEEAP